MKNRDAWRQQLTAIMKNKLQWKGTAELSDAMRLNEDLHIDSVMIVQMIVYIETEMNLMVPDEEVDPRTFSTIGSLLDFIATLPAIEAEVTNGFER